MAVENRHGICIRYLIDRGADINGKTVDGPTPLHKAISLGDESIVRVLLELGANPSLCCTTQTALGKMSLNAFALALLLSTNGSAAHLRIHALLQAAA